MLMVVIASLYFPPGWRGPFLCGRNLGNEFATLNFARNQRVTAL